MTSDLAIGFEDIQDILKSMLRARISNSGRYLELVAASWRWTSEISFLKDIPNGAALRSELTRDAMSLFDLPPEMFSVMEQCETFGSMAETLIQAGGNQPALLAFRTSGTAGEPRIQRHPFELLCQETRVHAEIFSGRKRILGLAPGHHIYGFLFTIMLPHALGVEKLSLPPLPTRMFFESLRDGDLVIAFPLFWTALSKMDVTLPQGVYGVTSTGPCPAEVIHALTEHGLERMSEIYGASETGGIGVRHNPDEPYSLFPFWELIAANETPGDGLIRRFPGGGQSESIRIPDVLDWPEQGRFYPIGRKDQAVQVAGENVYPGQVAQVIEEHPLVAQCIVRLMHPNEGGRLKAFIVPLDERLMTSNAKKELTAWISMRLNTAQMPRALRFGKSLPRSGMGKICDWDV